MSQWLDGQRQLTSLVAGDLRRQGVRETGRCSAAIWIGSRIASSEMLPDAERRNVIGMAFRDKPLVGGMAEQPDRTRRERLPGRIESGQPFQRFNQSGSRSENLAAGCQSVARQEVVRPASGFAHQD